jgi:hypothetical protein
MENVNTAQDTPLEMASVPFVGRWNTLVSTTNWEKGRIISQWRSSLQEQDSTVSEYSDEVWAQLVQGVSSQHAGRLRRVHDRFGTVQDQYEGLFWSHFQAALDWDDAEMWLEGAVQSKWTVAQMRTKRWETLGGSAELKPREEDIISSEMDEDTTADDEGIPQTLSGSVAEAHGASPDGSSAVAEDQTETEEGTEEGTGEDDDKASPDTVESVPRETVRPFADLGKLPDDLTEAFESFKLAILRHKSADWQEVSLEEIVGTLEALRELALAPSAD